MNDKVTVVMNRTMEEVTAYQVALGRPGFFKWSMSREEIEENKREWAWFRELCEEFTLENPCPYCYAEVGKPCPRPTGSHYGRLQLAGFRPFDGTNLVVRDRRATRWQEQRQWEELQKEKGVTIEIKRGSEIITSLVVEPQ